MLRLAQDEVAERRRHAEAEAAEIDVRARQEAVELPKRLEEGRIQLENDRAAMKLERERLLAEAGSQSVQLRGVA
jgi:hypothetical protein